MSQVRAGAAYVELTLRNAAFVKGLRSAQQQLASFASGAKMIGAKLASIGAGLAVPMAAGVAKFSQYDDAIRQVAAVSGATGEAFDRLNAKAKELGATTSFTAVEVANLMTELGRAGFNPRQIEEMTAAVMNLARATGTDATLSSGIMAATIRQFGMEADEATRVADGLTAAANKSFNTVEALGEALSYAGPVAADANMSLEETLAILGTLGNLGIQGSEAGTALRRLLTLGAAESEKFQQVFGVATKDAEGNARNLADILGDVAQSVAGLGTADKAAKFNEVFGLLGITSASAIGKTVTDTRALLKELENAGGIAAKTAAQMESGIGGSFRVVLSSIEGVAIAIGEALSEPIKHIADLFSSAATVVTNFIAANQRVVQVAALVAAGIAVAGATLITLGGAARVAAFAITGILSVISAIGTVVGLAGAAIAGLLSPVGLIVAGVAGFFIYLAKTQGILSGIQSAFGNAFGKIAADVQAATKQIAASLAAGDITSAGKVLWAALRSIWATGMASISGAFGGLYRSFVVAITPIADAAKVVFQSVIDIAGSVFGILSDLIGGAFSKLSSAGGGGDAISQSFASMLAMAAQSVAAVVQTIAKVMQSVRAWANENRTAILAAIGGFAAVKVAALAIKTAMIGVTAVTKVLSATWMVLKGVGIGIRAVFVALAAVQKIGAVVAAAFAGSNGLLSGSFGLLSGAIGVATTAMALFLSPIGLVVAAAAALGAYFLYASGVIDTAINDIQSGFETLKAQTLAAFGAIANALKAGDINAAVDVLWTYTKLQFAKGTAWVMKLWDQFAGFLKEVWANATYSLAGYLLQGLGAMRGLWDSTVKFMADGWTILTTSIQKGWNSSVGFLKKGFLRLYELVDIAGDVAIQIGQYLVDGMSGVEVAWVETIDYLADSWTTFVGQMKQMWNSTVGFLKKAWIKLKGLFDEDINVDAEIQKIDAETQASNSEDASMRQRQIGERASERAKRRQQIDANRKAMQDDLKRQLEQRRKDREGRDTDGQMAAIDAETAANNASVDIDAQSQLEANQQAADARAKATADYQASIDEQLAQMQRQAAAEQQARQQAAMAQATERDASVAEAQTEFDAAVARANSIEAPDPTVVSTTESTDVEPTVSPDLSAELAKAIADAEASMKPETPAPAITPPSPDPDVTKLQSDIAAMQKATSATTQSPPKPFENDPLQLADSEVALRLDDAAQKSIDSFGEDVSGNSLDESPSESTTADFSALGQTLGSGARAIEPTRLEPIQLDEAEPLPPVVVTQLPAADVLVEKPEDQTLDAPEPSILVTKESQAVDLPTTPPAVQTLDLSRLNEVFSAVMLSLERFEVALNRTTDGASSVGDGDIAGGEMSSDVQRAIIETAANTRRMANARGKLVFS